MWSCAHTEASPQYLRRTHFPSNGFFSSLYLILLTAFHCVYARSASGQSDERTDWSWFWIHLKKKKLNKLTTSRNLIDFIFLFYFISSRLLSCSCRFTWAWKQVCLFCDISNVYNFSMGYSMYYWLVCRIFADKICLTRRCVHIPGSFDNVRLQIMSFNEYFTPNSI